MTKKKLLSNMFVSHLTNEKTMNQMRNKKQNGVMNIIQR